MIDVFACWKGTCVLLLGGMFCKGQLHPVGWPFCVGVILSGSVSCWEKDAQCSKYNFGWNLPFLSYGKLLLPHLWVAVGYKHIYGWSFWCNSLFVFVLCLSLNLVISLEVYHGLVNILPIFDFFFLPFIFRLYIYIWSELLLNSTWLGPGLIHCKFFYLSS